jgi:hypothetical protein
MLRDQFITHHKAIVDGFRWRSREIARIEGFSDACFGFAVTLLIISLEVPRTSTELFEAMHGFIAFFVTFWILASIWYGQFLYFRRYGLEDRITVILNLVLIFTVLFFVYPLKFLFGAMVAYRGHLVTIATAHGTEPVILPAHKPLLLLIFGLGFAGVFLVFLLLYVHAYRQRESLGLNELEVFETQHSIRTQVFAIGTGLTYLGLAALEAMPRTNPGEKMLARSMAMVCLVIVLALVGWMVTTRRKRSAWMKEWHARQPETTLLHPPAGE